MLELFQQLKARTRRTKPVPDRGLAALVWRLAGHCCFPVVVDRAPHLIFCEHNSIVEIVYSTSLLTIDSSIGKNGLATQYRKSNGWKDVVDACRHTTSYHISRARRVQLSYCTGRTTALRASRSANVKTHRVLHLVNIRKLGLLGTAAL